MSDDLLAAALAGTPRRMGRQRGPTTRPAPGDARAHRCGCLPKGSESFRCDGPGRPPALVCDDVEDLRPSDFETANSLIAEAMNIAQTDGGA